MAIFWDDDRWVDDRPLNRQGAPAPLRPRRRLRRWLVAIAIVVLVPALLIPFWPVNAVGPRLPVGGNAVAATAAALAATVMELDPAADPTPTSAVTADPTPTATPDPTPTGTPVPTPTPVVTAVPTHPPLVSAVPTHPPVVTPTAAGCVGTLQSEIDAAAAGSVLDLTGCTYTLGATIGKPLTILRASIHVGPGSRGLLVTSSNVTLDGVHVLGGQYRNLNASEDGIYALGTASSPIRNLTIRNSEVGQFGHSGLWLVHVSNVTVASNQIHDVFYAGIMVLSGQGGTISGNTVKRIGVGWTSGGSGGGGLDPNNSYGIALSATQAPASADFKISGNTVTDVPTWHAFDTHGGQRISFTNNTVQRCSRGIFLTSDGLGDRATSITVQGNHLGSPAPVTVNLLAVTTYNTVNVTITGNFWSAGWGDSYFGDYLGLSTNLVVSNNTVN